MQRVAVAVAVADIPLALRHGWFQKCEPQTSSRSKCGPVGGVWAPWAGGAYHSLLSHKVLQLLGLVERRVERRTLEPLIHLLLVGERRAALDAERERVVPKLSATPAAALDQTVVSSGSAPAASSRSTHRCPRARPVQGRAIVVAALIRIMQVRSAQQCLELGMVVESAAVTEPDGAR